MGMVVVRFGVIGLLQVALGTVVWGDWFGKEVREFDPGGVVKLEDAGPKHFSQRHNEFCLTKLLDKATLELLVPAQSLSDGLWSAELGEGACEDRLVRLEDASVLRRGGGMCHGERAVARRSGMPINLE